MKPETPPARDLLALDLYERAMQRHQDLLKEAEHARMIKQIPVTGTPRRRQFKTLLAVLGSSLVSLGLRLQAFSDRKPAGEELPYSSRLNL